jgi:hypothetical protein
VSLDIPYVQEFQGLPNTERSALLFLFASYSWIDLSQQSVSGMILNVMRRISAIPAQ